jgi:hypothetical protein
MFVYLRQKVFIRNEEKWQKGNLFLLQEINPADMMRDQRKRLSGKGIFVAFCI